MTDFFFISGRGPRPRDRFPTEVSLSGFCLRRSLRGLFPCTGAIPALGVWGGASVLSTDGNRGGISPATWLTGRSDLPLANRRSDVAVELTTGLPFHYNDNLLGSRQLRGIEPGSFQSEGRGSIHYPSIYRKYSFKSRDYY